jgi:hypothetical protein
LVLVLVLVLVLAGFVVEAVVGLWLDCGWAHLCACLSEGQRSYLCATSIPHCFCNLRVQLRVPGPVHRA